MKRKQRYLDFSWRWLLLLALAFTWLPSTAVPVLAAGNITLNVVSAQNGAPITDYKYIINEDNTGTTAQRSPGGRLQPGQPGLPGKLQMDLDRRRARLEPDLHPRHRGGRCNRLGQRA